MFHRLDLKETHWNQSISMLNDQDYPSISSVLALIVYMAFFPNMFRFTKLIGSENLQEVILIMLRLEHFSNFDILIIDYSISEVRI